jgi:DNA/RNA endonuclease YhcR with UshA esterase domain
MPKPDYFHSMSTLISADAPARRWFLPIFVAILCTNLAGPISALASDVALTPVASITKSLTNHQITVQAVISNIRPPTSERAPYIVTLTQGEASAPLVFWSDMQTQLGSKITTGNVIRARVKVSTYRDQIQLRIANADAIEVVSGVTASATPTAPATPANPQAGAPPATPPTPAPTPMMTVIGKIKGDWVDRVVVVSGTISGSDKIDKGIRLSIQDATGEIQVVLGEKLLTTLPVAELQPGRALSVTGPIKVYEGKPAIIPDAPGAVALAAQ